MNTYRAIFIVAISALILSAVSGAAYCMVLPNEDDAISCFILWSKSGRDGVSEDELMDPLIAARGDIVPKITRALPAIPMPARRYAIAFLGNQADRRALPLLRSMLDNPAEADRLRGDALLSIGMIDLPEGQMLASRYRSGGPYLSSIADDVTRGQFFARRKKMDAILNVISRRFHF